ncbi:MAG: MBL fold metallo-hydrolase [Deltaproteobacteria bacterium]|nr:MBL fold metallo-hydrolase [Deltaproteobacteria bacterium]
MQVKQIKLTRMAVCCYLVADGATGECALIDPAFDTDRILATVARARLKVTRIINTHCHADHTAGNAALKAATGADICIHPSDAGRLTSVMNRAFARALGGKGSPRPDLLLHDGDAIAVGRLSLKVLHTPGHTPGGICLYADKHLFTGDTLFVGGIGRTDLSGGSMDQLIASIRQKIYTLPPDTIVWPGHHYGFRPSSTVEHERRTNPYTR